MHTACSASTESTELLSKAQLDALSVPPSTEAPLPQLQPGLVDNGLAVLAEVDEARATGFESEVQMSGADTANTCQEVVAAATTTAASRSVHEDEPKVLPPPTVTREELSPLVYEAMQSRGMNQSAVSARLQVSQCYLSMWLTHKHMPTHTKDAYTSALQAWVQDPSFFLRSPALTFTNPAAVAKSSTSRPAVPRSRAPHRPARGRGSARGGAGARAEKPGSLSQPSTPHGILTELLGSRSSVCLQLVPLSSSATGWRSSGGSICAEQSLLAQPESAFLLVRASPVVRDDETSAGEIQIALAEAEDAIGALCRPWVLHRDSTLTVPGEEAVQHIGAARAAALPERPQRRRREVAYSGFEDDLDADELVGGLRAGGKSEWRGRAGGSASMPSCPQSSEQAAEACARVVRRRIIDTLQRIATAPYEHRAGLRRACRISQIDGGISSVQWCAFCAVCGQWFEHVVGPTQLAAHAALHQLHAEQQIRRREGMQTVIQRLRSANSAMELRAVIEEARRLSRLLADAPLQQALLKAETRLRAMERPQHPVVAQKARAAT